MLASFELDSAIYNKYFAEAKRLGVVWTLRDWAVKEGLFIAEEIEKDDHAYCEWENNFEHAHAVKKILNYEIAYFVFRRLNGCWGEVTDFFWRERNRFCNEYRSETGYDVVGNSVDLN